MARVIGISVWIGLAFYSALSICIPEIRLICWKGTDKKLGAVTYLGLTLFFWSPAIAMTGLISQKGFFVVYLAMLFAGVVVLIGYLKDVSDG